MAQTKVVFYKDKDKTVPTLEWLDTIPLKARLKCLAKIERLKQEGHQLRRPEADLLRDKIYELRIKFTRDPLSYPLFFSRQHCCGVVSWNHKRRLCSTD